MKQYLKHLFFYPAQKYEELFMEENSFEALKKILSKQNNSVQRIVSPPNVESNEYFPQKTHLKFESVNIEGIAKKLEKFSKQLSPELKLESKDIQTLLKLLDPTLDVQPEHLRLIRLILLWPKSNFSPLIVLILIYYILLFFRIYLSRSGFDWCKSFIAQNQ